MIKSRTFSCSLLMGALLASAACTSRESPPSTVNDNRKPDVIFVPTPPEVVDKMLEVAKITQDDVVFDLGCGDGRIVIQRERLLNNLARVLGTDLYIVATK